MHEQVTKYEVRRMGNEKCERAKRHAQKTTNKQRQTDNRDTESSSTYVTNKLTNKNKRNETKRAKGRRGRGRGNGTAHKSLSKNISGGAAQPIGWPASGAPGGGCITRLEYTFRERRRRNVKGGGGIVVPWQEQGKWMNGWMNGSEGGAGRKMDGRATNEGTCDNLYRTS